MKFGILRDKFKLKKFLRLYFVFEYWFRDIKGLIEGDPWDFGIEIELAPQYLVCPPFSLVTALQKGHPRNIPVKLFQSRTRGGEMEFLHYTDMKKFFKILLF